MTKWPSLRPALGLLLFLEFLFWAGTAAAWFAAKAVVPSLTLHRMEFWPLLMLTGLLTVMMMGHLRWRHRAMQALSDVGRLNSVFEGYRIFLPTWKFLLVRLALGALMVAWLDPKMGSKLQEVESEGVDVMVALDVSNSMLTEDVGMPRLDLAQRTIERLLASTAGDRLGLVVFAGEAYVQCPLTTDVEALKMFLETTSTGMVPTQGTAVGNAIEACWQGFDPTSEASRVVLVFTDGENHEDDVVQASRKVMDEGGTVHFIGLATLEGGPIPLLDSRGRTSGFRADKSGQPVVSRLDESSLIEAAQAGGGTYVRAGRGFVELTPFLQFKNQLDSAQISSVSYVDYEHHLLPWLILAAILLLLESLLPKRPFRRLSFAFPWLLVMAWGHSTSASAQASPKEHLVKGTEAFRDGRFEEAIVEFGGGTTDAHWAPLALYNQGCAYLQEQDFESAMSAFGQSIELSEDDKLKEQAHYNASLSALMKGDAAQSIEHAKSALRLNPSNDDARHNLALAKRLQQQQQDQQQQDQQDQQQQDQQQQDQQQQDQQQQDQQQQDQQQQDQQQQDQQQQDQKQQDQQQQDQQQQQEGQISRADMERILESLERQEADVQAKLRAAQAKEKGKGQPKSIEKDW